jgi:hypothetical protein
LGLSRYFSSATAEAFSLVGSPFYMSPEAISAGNEGWCFLVLFFLFVFLGVPRRNVLRSISFIMQREMQKYVDLAHCNLIPLSSCEPHAIHARNLFVISDCLIRDSPPILSWPMLHNKPFVFDPIIRLSGRLLFRLGHLEFCLLHL